MGPSPPPLLSFPYNSSVDEQWPSDYRVSSPVWILLTACTQCSLICSSFLQMCSCNMAAGPRGFIGLGFAPLAKLQVIVCSLIRKHINSGCPLVCNAGRCCCSMPRFINSLVECDALILTILSFHFIYELEYIYKKMLPPHSLFWLPSGIVSIGKAS